MQKYFYKFDQEVLHENTGNPIYVVKNVQNYKNAENKGGVSVFKIITGGLHREFKAKIGLFKEVNSYNNLYAID